MVLRGNNSNNEFSCNLAILLETSFAKIAIFQINVDSNIQTFQTMNGPVSMYNGPLSATLDVKFYLDQIEVETKSLGSLMGELEYQASRFCAECDAAFQSRNYSYNTSKVIELNYSFKLFDYDRFLKNVEKFGRERIDREFTQALEAKLSED